MHLQTDYLVIGAGVSGLCFTDELLTRSDAHITIADLRDAPADPEPA
jgi:L-2-hydroxyglutarate oxidase LhgO